MTTESRSAIERRYGVPLPIDVLWRELEQRLDPAAVAELQGIYREAMRRYGRAGRLNKMRLDLARWDARGYKVARAERYRAALADPQGYIDAPSDAAP